MNLVLPPPPPPKKKKNNCWSMDWLQPCVIVIPNSLSIKGLQLLFKNESVFLESEATSTNSEIINFITLLVTWLSIVNLQTCHSSNVNINHHSSDVVRNNKPFLKTSSFLSSQPFMSEWNNHFYLKHQIILSKDYLLSALLA